MKSNRAAALALLALLVFAGSLGSADAKKKAKRAAKKAAKAADAEDFVIAGKKRVFSFFDFFRLNRSRAESNDRLLFFRCSF